MVSKRTIPLLSFCRVKEGNALNQGEKLLIVHRRLFENDTPRLFVGEVLIYEAGIVKVKRYTFVKDLFNGNMQKTPIFAQRPCRLSQGPLLCIKCR